MYVCKTRCTVCIYAHECWFTCVQKHSARQNMSTKHSSKFNPPTTCTRTQSTRQVETHALMPRKNHWPSAGHQASRSLESRQWKTPRPVPYPVRPPVIYDMRPNISDLLIQCYGWPSPHHTWTILDYITKQLLMNTCSHFRINVLFIFLLFQGCFILHQYEYIQNGQPATCVGDTRAEVSPHRQSLVTYLLLTSIQEACHCPC